MTIEPPLSLSKDYICYFIHWYLSDLLNVVLESLMCSSTDSNLLNSNPVSHFSIIGLFNQHLKNKKLKTFSFNAKR